jgi:hypothetical protein
MFMSDMVERAMNTRKWLVMATLVVTAAMASSPALAQGQQVPMMGPGMMGYGMGPGMMGYGMGPGMMGYGPMGPGMMGYGMGPGMMGYGMGPGMMGYGPMGPGMMGYGGMGPGMMGPYWGGGQPALNLTVNDVKGNLERWIASTGNPNIKVGNVVEKDANTITADVVTKDNSLVQQFAVDRRTGFYRPTQ